MKKTIIILSLIVSLTSCKLEKDNDTVFYNFNSEEKNFLDFELNESVSFIDNHGDEYKFKVTKDSLYHRKSESVLNGTAYIQHNDIRLNSTDSHNLFITIQAEKSRFFEYRLEIGETPFTEDTYFYFLFQSDIQKFEIIDTVVDNVPYSGLYALRSNQSIPNVAEAKTIILMNSENGIVLIDKTDKNSAVKFRLRKK